MRLDTLEQNVCGPKTFTIPLWVGDVPVSDSLYAATIVLSWDITTLDLEDFVLVNANTLCGGLSKAPLVVKDGTLGILYIELGTDPSGAPIAGAGKPLLFLRGSITALDTVGGQQGWVDISSASFSANVQYDPFERRPGIIRVVRDTTPAYTGRITVAAGEFDTLRYDTVDITLDNIAGRKVRSVSFAVVADTARFAFVDTLATGTLAGTVPWLVSDVQVRTDTLAAYFEATADIGSNGPLLRVVLERRTRGTFASRVEVVDFRVNPGSCLGRLTREGAAVTGATIPMSGVGTRIAHNGVRLIPIEAGFVVEGLVHDDVSILVYDAVGARVEIRRVEWTGPATLVVTTANRLPTGRYFVVMRDQNSYVNKQFTAIR